MYKRLTDKQIELMDKQSLAAELSNRVYDAAFLLEQLEHAGRISGNGHHKAQRVAALAEDLLRDAWKC